MNEKKKRARNAPQEDERNQKIHINNIKKELYDRELERGNRGDFHERRRQTDWVVHAAAILSLISWLIAFAFLTVFEMAAPDRRMEGVSRALGYATRAAWTEAYLPVAFALLITSLAACIAAFIFNMMRMRRKTDKYRKSIIIIGIATIIGLLLFVLRFSEFLF